MPDVDYPTPAAVNAAFNGLGAGQLLIQAMEDSLAEMELCMIALDNAGSDEIGHLAHAMLNQHARLGQRMQVPSPQIRPEHAALHGADPALLRELEHYAALQDGGEVSLLAQACEHAQGAGVAEQNLMARLRASRPH